MVVAAGVQPTVCVIHQGTKKKKNSMKYKNCGFRNRWYFFFENIWKKTPSVFSFFFSFA